MAEDQRARQRSPRADLAPTLPGYDASRRAPAIQPHGVLLALRESDFTVLRASLNVPGHLDRPLGAVLGQRLDGLDEAIQNRPGCPDHRSLDERPQPFRWHDPLSGRRFRGMVHRVDGGLLIVELEGTPEREPEEEDVDARSELLAWAASRISAAPSMGALGDSVVRSVRRLTGYDRVMLCTFDDDGHGEVISEARDPELDSFVGLHYPASDVPRKGREAIIRERVRLLVDVEAEPVEVSLEAGRCAFDPVGAVAEPEPLDLSRCHLRAPSPRHVESLRRMGVHGALIVSVVRAGELWGLLVCHHRSARGVPYPIRASCELLAEMVSTRITALESYAQAHSEVVVRRIEHRMIESTSRDGDFRQALFDDRRTLLQPMNATGAALSYQGELRTVGEVPSTPELRQLIEWIATSTDQPLFHTASLGACAPHLEALSGTASGVVSMEISRATREYLLWFRTEQVRTVIWAGDPHGVDESGGDAAEDAIDLSPRQAFAAWHEQVRGTSRPWTDAETAFARTLGASLVDMVIQVRGVRLLIVQSQIDRLRRDIMISPGPIVIADRSGEILLENDAFANLFRRPRAQLRHLSGLPSLFADRDRARQVMRSVTADNRSWSGELRLIVDDGADGPSAIPMNVRVHPVPGDAGAVLGYVLLLTDLRARRAADMARHRLREAIVGAHPPTLLSDRAPSTARRHEALLQSILANANVAAMEVGDGAPPPLMPHLLQEVRASTRRAAELSDVIRSLRSSPGGLEDTDPHDPTS